MVLRGPIDEGRTIRIMISHPSHTAMLEGRLLTMRQEVRRAVGEVRAALCELDKIDAGAFAVADRYQGH